MATQVTVTTLAEGATTSDLVNVLLAGGSSGVSISNVVYSGDISAAGTFTGIGSGIFNSGLILSSGDANNAENPAAFFSSTTFGTRSGTVYDPASLSFDFVPTGTQIVFSYRIGTEEYLGSPFADPFTLTLDGTNIALLPNGNPVTIANLTTASGYGVRNVSGAFGAAYDGFSIQLTATATVVPGQTYHLAFNVADGGDFAFDTAVFIQGGSLRSNAAPTVATALSNQSATPGAAFSYAVPSGTFADADTGDTLTLSARLTDGSALPTWLSFNASTQTFSGTPPTGTTATVAIRVTATDNGGLTATSDFNLAVSAIPPNTAPVFTGLGVGTSLVQGGAAVAVATGVVVSDVDSTTFDHGSLTVSVSNNAHAGDVVSIAQTGGITLSGASVSYNGSVIGTVSGGSGTPLVVSLANGVGAVAVTALTQAITLANATNAVTNDTRTLTFALNDGGGTANGGHDTTSFTITVAASDPVPSVTGITADPGTGTHGVGSTILFSVATSEAVTVAGTPTLLLSDGGTATYVSGSGTSTLVFSHTVAAGHNAADLTVTGIDLAGGSIGDGAAQALASLPAGGVNPAGTLTVDTAAPAAPTVTLVSDTGASATDHVTRDARITVTAAEAGGTFAYSVDGGAYTASYDPSALGDGKHLVLITHTDIVGNVSAAGSVGFILDRTAPAAPTLALVSDTGASATDLVTKDATLAVTVAETGGSLAYSVDGSAFSANYDPAALSDGKHTIAITQTDIAGNVSAAGSLAFTLDRTAPAAPVLALVSDTGASATDLVTKDATLVVTAEAGGSLAYSVDGSAYAANYNPAALSDGKHTVSVVQTDAAGNVSATGSLAFTLDRTAPVVTIAGASGATNVVDHVLSGSVEAGLAGTSVTISDGSNVVGTAVVQADGSWALPFAVAGDGATHAYTFAVAETDLAGNTGSASFTFSVDFTGNAGLFGALVQDHVPAGSIGQVAALYDGIFDRAPDIRGWEGWVPALDRGLSLHDFAVQLLSSDEFSNRYGSYQAGSDADFVSHLYQSALHRDADAPGLQHWTAALSSGTSRADVAIAISLSEENHASMGAVPQGPHYVPDATSAVVARLYHELLERAPDATGLSQLSGGVHGGVSLAQVADILLGSPEYAALHAGQSDADFVASLYRNALGRAGEETGTHAWLDALSHGVSRGEVATAFAESAEAIAHLAGRVENGWHLHS